MSHGCVFFIYIISITATAMHPAGLLVLQMLRFAFPICFSSHTTKSFEFRRIERLNSHLATHWEHVANASSSCEPPNCPLSFFTLCSEHAISCRKIGHFFRHFLLTKRRLLTPVTVFTRSRLQAVVNDLLHCGVKTVCSTKLCSSHKSQQAQTKAQTACCCVKNPTGD